MEWNISNIYELVRGPVAWICFFIFMAGTVFQITRFFKLSVKINQPVFEQGDPPHKSQEDKSARYQLAYLLSRLRVSIIGMHPFMFIVTVVFHFSIFMLPLFLREHNSLMDILWGVSFCPHILSHNTADMLFVIICCCMLVFAFRRLFTSRVRALTDFGDVYLYAVTGAPFVSGYLAVHNVFDYQMLVIVHILSVEILLVSLPFTKFVHMIFFFLNRFWSRGELGFRTAKRVW